MKWLAETCQYRSGKQRNVIFAKEKVTLKGLLVFMQFGSIIANFQGCCSVVKDQGARLGEKGFRRLLLATTLKGTYNQGLSYFYVDFLDLTKLINDLLKWLETPLKKDKKISKEDIKAALAWVETGREDTKLISDYLRHGFYADIRKSTEDGFYCVSHALGCKCDHQHMFGMSADLNIALLNHMLLAYIVDVIWDTPVIDDRDLDELAEEYWSMHSFAIQAGLETLHYTKHLMHRWWQERHGNQGTQKNVENCSLDERLRNGPQEQALTSDENRANVSLFFQVGSECPWSHDIMGS
jgi:hypothetical protein